MKKASFIAAAVVASVIGAAPAMASILDLDDVAAGTVGSPFTVGGVPLTSANDFSLELKEGSLAYNVTVSFSFNQTADDVGNGSFGVGGNSDVLSALTEEDFSFSEVFVVDVGESLFVNFAVVSAFKNSAGYTLALEATPVPLPAGLPLILAGVGALGLVARVKKRRSA